MRDSQKGDPLVVRTLEFLGGMAEAGGWRPPPSLPEVAFAGRSNVGKSSLINALVHRRKFARVSNTPGRTREINFFRVNDQFVLADLPGYGYARISKEKRAAWRPLIEGYLKGSNALRGVVQLLDARRTPSEDDLQMLEFLAHRGTPTLVIATKVDKLRKSEREKRLTDLALEAGVDSDQLIPFSAETGEGRNELAEAIVGLVATNIEAEG
ncbi:MAG TPA: ribosome biogenesis GTP-binding protein YihA/YsxC [Gemmatimonadaceae bacterium]|nr:ribosome biogenesis GTP-binding protein YihA/YsxC [Gemmatimonadaceae bacterium]